MGKLLKAFEYRIGELEPEPGERRKTISAENLSGFLDRLYGDLTAGTGLRQEEKRFLSSIFAMLKSALALIVSSFPNSLSSPVLARLGRFLHLRSRTDKEDCPVHSRSLDALISTAWLRDCFISADRAFQEFTGILEGLEQKDVFEQNVLDVFQDLLSSAKINNGGLALRYIDRIPGSLFRAGIRVIEFDGENEDLFHLSEANVEKSQTLRPALVKGETALRCGQAVVPKGGVRNGEPAV